MALKALPEISLACRVCGCTDEDCYNCYERTGELCHWTEPDLCSACAEGVYKLEREIAESLNEAFQDGVDWALNQVLLLLQNLGQSNISGCRNGRRGVPGECPQDCRGEAHNFDFGEFMRGAKERGIYISGPERVIGPEPEAE